MASVSLESFGQGPLLFQIYQVVGTVAFFGLMFGALIYSLVIPARRRRAAQFKGPALTGTAHVLSAARAGGLAGTLGVNVYREVLCVIGLRVELSGRTPYDVTVTTPLDSQTLIALCVDGQRWEPGRPWQVKPGTTVAVEVDSTNPENVRIGRPTAPASPFNGQQPTRRGWFDYSDMSPGARRLMLAWWVVSVGGIATVVILLVILR
jgi:hypothetical protein